MGEDVEDAQRGRQRRIAQLVGGHGQQRDDGFAVGVEEPLGVLDRGRSAVPLDLGIVGVQDHLREQPRLLACPGPGVECGQQHRPQGFRLAVETQSDVGRRILVPEEEPEVGACSAEQVGVGQRCEVAGQQLRLTGLGRIELRVEPLATGQMRPRSAAAVRAVRRKRDRRGQGRACPVPCGAL